MILICLQWVKTFNFNFFKCFSFVFSEVLVLYMYPPMTLEAFSEGIRGTCHFDALQPFTMKFVDEDGHFIFILIRKFCSVFTIFFFLGDPCTISHQCELDEAFRLYFQGKDADLSLHGLNWKLFLNCAKIFSFKKKKTLVFPNVPFAPGAACDGENPHVYRKGARRWKKTYCVNGHAFHAKRFNKVFIFLVPY